MKKIVSILMVVMMMLALALPVAAEISPEPEPEYDVDTGVAEGEGEVYDQKNDDGTVTIIAKPDEGHNFIKWEIDGEYEIISGSLTDKEVVVKPLSDLKAHAYFDGDKVVERPDEDEDSPQTGVTPVIFAVATLVSFAGAGFAFKKSRENA